MENQEPGKFFVTGGTLAPDAPSYVVRSADAELYEGLRHGEFCYVLNTRQMGKSSLMVRTAKRLQESGATVAVIDLTAIGRNVTPAQWYNGMLSQIGAQRDDDGTTDDALSEFWRHTDLSPLQRFFAALEAVFLEENSPHLPGSSSLIIFLDEVDATRSLPFPADEFFAGIRECYNRRATDSRWHRLTFCLLGVATPADLIADARMSPFNIGRRIRLTDFTEKECLLSFVHGAHEILTETVVRRTLYWTGGHPYLTQRLLRAFAEIQDREGSTGRGTEARIDALCETLFLNRDSRDNDDNLTFVRNRLLRGGEDLSALLDLYGKIRSGKRIRDDETDALRVALRLAGVVKPDAQGFLVVRNRIYDRFFDREWIEAHLPEREARRQRAAFWRGVWRSAGFGAAGVVAFGTLAGVAIRQAQEAQRLTRLAQERLSISNAQNGLRLLEEGDPQAALVPLTEALEADERYLPERVEMARIRLAAARRVAPDLAYEISCGSPILCATLDPQHRRVATGTEAGSLRLHDARTGKPLTPMMQMDGAVRHVAFSPDGAILASASSAGTVRLWNTETGTPLGPAIRYHNSSPATHVDWSPDGKTLAISGMNGSVLFDVPSGTNRRAIWDTDVPPWKISDPPIMETRAVAFLPQGERLAFVATNYLSNLADVKTGKMKGVLASCYNASQIAFRPDGRRAVIAGEFSSSRRTPGGKGGMLYDTATGREIALLPHRADGLDARFSPDGKRLATAAQDGTARFWDSETGKPRTSELRQNGGISSIRFSLDGERVVTASQSGTAQVWDAAQGTPLGPPLRHQAPLTCADFVSGTNDRNAVLTAGMDGFLRLWQPTPRADQGGTNAMVLAPAVPGAIISMIPGRSGRYIALRYRPVGTSERALSHLTIWDSLTRTRVFPPLGKPAPTGTILGSNEEHTQIALWDGKTVRVYDALSGRVTFAHDLPGKQPGRAEFIADTDLLTLFFNRTSLSFDLRTKTILPQNSNRSNLLPVALRRVTETPYQGEYAHVWNSRKNRFVLFYDTHLQPALASRYANRMTLWDMVRNTGRIFPGAWRDIFIIAFSPEERYMLLTTRDTCLYALDSGRETILPFKSGTHPMVIAFSPDESRVLTGSNEGVAQVWDTGTGKAVLPPLVHPGTIVAIAFRPDGKCFATAASDGSVFVWDARTGERVLPVLRPPGGVRQLAFTLDNTALVTTGESGVRLFDLLSTSP